MPLVNVDILVSDDKMQEITVLLDGVKDGVAQVTSRAINKVAVSARTQIVRRVAKDINVKQSELRDHRVKLRQASYNSLIAWIFVSGKRLPLGMFSPRETKLGVRYRIRRGQRADVPGAFVATAKGQGRVQVFAREYVDGTSGKRVGRHPLRMLRGPAIGQVVQDIEEFAPAVLDRQLAEKLEGEIDNQLGLVLARRGLAAVAGSR